jgi:hypothetical protein
MQSRMTLMWFLLCRDRGSGPTWECHKCTFHNDPNAPQCEMCHTQYVSSSRFLWKFTSAGVFTDELFAPQTYLAVLLTDLAFGRRSFSNVPSFHYLSHFTFLCLVLHVGTQALWKPRTLARPPRTCWARR